MRCLVTGGAGFIGSNLARKLVKLGYQVTIVDTDKTGEKLKNYSGIPCDFRGSKSEFHVQGFDTVFHLGACTDTRLTDVDEMLLVNYEKTKVLFNESKMSGVRNFVYASSAAVYGRSSQNIELPLYEHPLNAYGFSKLQVDNWIRRQNSDRMKVVGLRYFNVYGPGEDHKGRMMSLIGRMIDQKLVNDGIFLFNGDNTRDYVYVDDVVDATIEARLDHVEGGIYNIGTGEDHSPESIASMLDLSFSHYDMPAEIRKFFQFKTKANLQKMRDCGFKTEFRNVKDGVEKYLLEKLEEYLLEKTRETDQS